MSSTLLIILGLIMLATVWWIFKKGLKLFAFVLIVGGVLAVAYGFVSL